MSIFLLFSLLKDNKSELFFNFFIFISMLFLLTGCKTVPNAIISRPKLNSSQLTAFFIHMRPDADIGKIKRISSLYIEESKIESVNSDIAFAQMCLETGYLSFGGLVKSDMNNFCGLGAIDEVNNGVIFENEKIGIRAHIQHLKAYASKKPLIQDCVDPRYRFISPKGIAPKIQHLTGKWATDPEYSNKIKNILYTMYQFSF